MPATRADPRSPNPAPASMTMPPAPSADPPPAARVPTRVWDLPTRVFHWGLAAVVAGALATGEIGEPWMAWHFRLGQAALALLVFRLAWGLVGGRWSRFASFLPSAGRLRRYLRGEPDEVPAGHNPLGALSVWAMLALLLAQAATGLFADDEISVTGPFSHLAGSVATHRATAWHVHWGLTALFVLLGLHLLAVAWHVLRRHSPILRAMWTGDQPLPAGTPPSRDTGGTRLLAAVLAVVAAAAVFGAVARWGA